MKIAMIRCLVILFLSVMSYGCAKNSQDPYVRAHLEKPDWVTGESDKYPSHLYISGRSVSAKLKQAKRQSIEDLATNLNRQIESFLAKSSSVETTQADAVIAISTNHVDEKTRTTLLQHRQFSETWQDPATRAYHVLSTIDRVTVGEELLSDVYRLDAQVERILSKAQAEKDVLQRVAFAKIAITKLEQRKNLQRLVKIIKPIITVKAPEWDEEKIRIQISRWLSDIKILPIATHKEFNLLNAMRDGVESAGMTVHIGAKPDYILKATFTQSQVKWKNGVYSIEGNLKIKLLDGEWKGQVRGDANWPIEVTALERKQLPQHLAEAIKIANQKNLRATLLTFEE